jgi:glycosyltransferase involved in cell wall biosynthesis
MGAKLPVSVVIIARNEEANIGRCLASVAAWAGEMIVVINDCTDRTREIAKSMGANVIEETWYGYREQKNRAMAHSTLPWILSLDADEVVSPRLRESIGEFLCHPGKNAGASFSRRLFFMGKWIQHGDCYPDRVLRLFRRSSARWIGGSVHETLQLDGPQRRLRGDLEHYSYMSLNDQLQRMAKYAALHLYDRRSRKFKTLNIALRVFWKFFRGYFFRLGFLDGFPGFYLALQRSFATCYDYSCLLEAQGRWPSQDARMPTDQCYLNKNLFDQRISTDETIKK